MTTQKILNRDFILCFFAQITFSASYHSLIPTLPIYLSKLGSTEAEIGLLIGILGISSLFLRPFVGRALLETPEKKFMVLGASLFAATSAAYILAAPFWPFLMVRILQGIGLAFFHTASLTLIANISPEGRRERSFSYFYLAQNTSFALAPSFGMSLINYFSFTVLFSACVCLSLCSAFITTRLSERQVGPSEKKLVDNSSFLNRKSLPPSIMAFLAEIFWGSLTAFFPLYAVSHGVNNPGLFFGAFAITLILGRILGGKIFDIHRRELVILPCVTAHIISMVVLAFSKTLTMFIFVAMIWGIGNAFLFPSLMALAIDLSGSSRGTAVGTFMAFSALGIGLGAIIMGIILRLSNFRVMFLCLAFVGIINFSFFLFFVRKKGENLQKETPVNRIPNTLH